MISIYGCSHNLGLRAEYPEQHAGHFQVDSLQPTLQWESFPPEKDLKSENKIFSQVSDVTYQLRIKTEGWYYSKDDLPEAHHRIEVSLRPSTVYLWTVARARSIICALAVDRLAVSGANVASMLNLSASAVSKLASRGRKDSLREKIENVIFNLNY